MKRYEPGPLLGSLSESPLPIRAGAMQRPRGCRGGNTFPPRDDEGGLPCSSTMGAPPPPSTYAISLPRTRRRCFWYGNAAEIIFASPSFFISLFFSRYFPMGKKTIRRITKVDRFRLAP